LFVCSFDFDLPRSSSGAVDGFSQLSHLPDPADAYLVIW
jgi:hypothetical protein